MTVIEAFKELNQLIINGEGNLELVHKDINTGYSGSVNLLASETNIVTENEEGLLADVDLGTKYVPITISHTW